MKYTFQNLLTKDNNGTLSGAMSPFMMAMEVCQVFQIDLNGLTRITFEADNITHQVIEGSGNEKELTGHDTLIIAEINKTFNAFAMFVDMGSSFCPVALWFSDEADDLTFTPIYSNYPFEKKLTEDEVRGIFTNLNSNSQHFIPKQK